MRRFAQLYQALDSTTSTQRKIQAIVAYLEQTPAADAAWAIYFLGAGKLRRRVNTTVLRELAIKRSGLAPWLFEECYQSVGDLAETVSLLWPEKDTGRNENLAQWIEAHLLAATPSARTATAACSISGSAPETRLTPAAAEENPEQTRQAMLEHALSGWDSATRFVSLKLLTGGLRVGVSRQTVVRALAGLCGLETTQVAQRMTGYLSNNGSASGKPVWPSASRYEMLLSTHASDVSELTSGQPYPFFLAHPWPVKKDESVQTQLGPPENWWAEWKWDGIRAQIIRRRGEVWVWSRGEELISEQFPEVCEYARKLPEGTVIDGELLVWPSEQDRPQPFAALQRRLGRRQVSARLMRELPVTVMAYDLLESEGQDWRSQPLLARKARLEEVILHCCAEPADRQANTQRTGPWHEPWRLSAQIALADWSELEPWQSRARDLGVEGLMLKAAQGHYGMGRTRASGPWYKFKCDPMTVDAVLIYAQRGHGRRAGLYTDYTFGVWSAPPGDPQRTLIPVTKAYSGLNDAEIREVDAIIKKSTQQSFGPVRKVDPALVFEIGFEGIAASARHKSGVALRFSRMLRWRKDKPASEADSIFTLRALMP
ncbi:ATP-dependent DNA ligase [Orrella marina]|uniref:DNA ligase (ATP) n=1 Tax=Orrella marina TaxID=2163011 RepID=A0A2R4XHG4_9BURK|nr:ATP-dependent DNA ligase [Orrella marina]AWB33211.1 ATP-dependent DNA ligase [Orrella marina]